MTHQHSIFEGGCACGAVRYRLDQAPLIVHACHCRNCQRQSGSWHAVNALIESASVKRLQGAIADWELPTPTGAGQTVTRCVECGVALWSQYHAFSQGKKDIIRFIRVGTLDNPEHFPPDVHIFDASRNPHAPRSYGAPRYDGFYNLKEIWTEDSLNRLFSCLQAAAPARSYHRVSAGHH